MSLREKETVAPVAQTKRAGNKTRQEKGCRSYQKPEGHRHCAENFREESKNSEGEWYVIFLLPICDLVFPSLAAVPTQCLLGAMSEKSQCYPETQKYIRK